MKKLSHLTMVIAVLSLILIGCEAPATNPVETSLSGDGGTVSLAKVTTNLKVPINETFDIPCAGESVTLSGNLHVLLATTLDGNGGFHTKFHFQPQGISGVGSITGNKYQGTGVTQGQTNGTVGEVTSEVNNFRIIGQGTGNNLLVHQTVHITVNANGTVTATVNNSSVNCK